MSQGTCFALPDLHKMLNIPTSNPQTPKVFDLQGINESVQLRSLLGLPQHGTTNIFILGQNKLHQQQKLTNCTCATRRDAHHRDGLKNGERQQNQSLPDLEIFELCSHKVVPKRSNLQLINPNSPSRCPCRVLSAAQSLVQQREVLDRHAKFFD